MLRKEHPFHVLQKRFRRDGEQGVFALVREDLLRPILRGGRPFQREVSAGVFESSPNLHPLLDENGVLIGPARQCHELALHLFAPFLVHGRKQIAMLREPGAHEIFLGLRPVQRAVLLLPWLQLLDVPAERGMRTRFESGLGEDVLRFLFQIRHLPAQRLLGGLAVPDIALRGVRRFDPLLQRIERAVEQAHVG